VAGYELLITARAAREIDALPRKKDRHAVVERIRKLREQPRPSGCTKLSGGADLYRVRQGRFRIVYTIEDDRLVVIVVKVGDRKDVYRKGGRPGGRTRPFEPDP
jgi:mRNA interferase RelE/StbE